MQGDDVVHSLLEPVGGRLNQEGYTPALRLCPGRLQNISLIDATRLVDSFNPEFPGLPVYFRLQKVPRPHIQPVAKIG
ncbi:hypothetical protein D3C81_1988730 [compost metagenome]